MSPLWRSMSLLWSLLQSIIAKHIESGGMVILTTHQEVPLTSGEIKRLSLGNINA